MAASGSKSITVTAYDTLKFSWTAGAPDIGKNQTPVSWKMELIAVRYGAIVSSASKSWSVTVNGTTYSGSNTVGISDNQTKTLASGTTTIAHNPDGTKTFNYSFSQQFNINFNGYVGTISGSGSGTLNPIPRATTPTLDPIDVIMGNDITISLSRASSSFTHTLQHAFFVGEWTTFATGVTTSASLSVPTSWANRIPNATSGGGRIRCLTYNGSTLIGEKIVTFTATVPASEIPTISSVTATELVSGMASKFGVFVQHHSKLKIIISASGIDGSTIKSYETKFQNEILQGAIVETGLITGSGQIPITVTVTDSRGRKGTRVVNITAVAYEPPKIYKFEAYRADDGGVQYDEGTQLKCEIDFEISSVDNKNDRLYKIEYSLGDSNEWQEIARGNAYGLNTPYLNTDNLLNGDNPYKVRLIVSDYFYELPPFVIDVPTAFTLVDYHESGRGIAFGKVAEFEDVLDSDLVVYPRKGFKPVMLPAGTDLDDVKAPNNYIGIKASDGHYSHSPIPDDYTTTFCLSVMSCGDTDQLYQKLTTSSKTTSRTYERFYYSGSWGDWRQLIYADEGLVAHEFIELRRTTKVVVAANGRIPFDAIENKSTCFSYNSTDNTLLIGDGVKRVRVSFVCGGSSAGTVKRIWANIQQDRGGAGIRWINAIQYGDFVSPHALLVVDVQKGDILKFYVADATNVADAGVVCYAYVEKVA